MAAELCLFRGAIMDNSDNENPVNNNFPSGNEAQIKTDSVSAEEETANAQRKKRLSEIRFSECGSGGQRFAWLMNYIFIDGMSGMALGLFATLIAGTIIWQIGDLIDSGGNNFFGLALEAIGKVAQVSMGAGIGVGI